MFKVNTRNTRILCKICSKLTIKTPERRVCCRSAVFIVNFEHISHLFLLFLLLTLSRHLSRIFHVKTQDFQKNFLNKFSIDLDVFSNFGNTLLNLQTTISRLKGIKTLKLILWNFLNSPRTLSKNILSDFLKIDFILPVAMLQKHRIQTYEKTAKKKENKFRTVAFLQLFPILLLKFQTEVAYQPC